MRLVLDASAAVSAVAGDARALVDDAVDRASIVITPELFIPEVTNGLWKYVKAGILTTEDAVRVLSTALGLIDEYRSVADLAEEALREAAAHRHSAYDLYYAVLARREGAVMLTTDGRLKEICQAMSIPLADA